MDPIIVLLQLQLWALADAVMRLQAQPIHPQRIEQARLRYNGHVRNLAIREGAIRPPRGPLHSERTNRERIKSEAGKLGFAEGRFTG